MLTWTVATDKSPAEATISIEGELDLYGAPNFTKAVRAGIAQGWKVLALDFSSLSYLDSTGVGSIIRILQALKARGGRLSSRGLQGSPRKVLEMSNIIVLLNEEKGSKGRP